MNAESTSFITPRRFAEIPIARIFFPLSQGYREVCDFLKHLLVSNEASESHSNSRLYCTEL
jgi:hypothetical protein